MKVLVALFLSFCLITTGLLVSGNAQQDNKSGRYIPPAAPGTPEYYRDDRVRYSAIKAVVDRHSPYEAIINGDPQVPGGITGPAPEGEEDVTVTQLKQENGGKPVMVETISKHLVIYLVNLPEYDKHGVIVKVRRNKKTKKTLAVINCGNWAREVGKESEECPPEKPCVPYDKPIVDNNATWTDPETGETLPAVKYDYGCGRTETLVKKPGRDTPCDDTLYRNIITIGNRTGSLTKAQDFIVRDELIKRFGAERAQPFIDELERQEAGITSVKIRFLDIWQQGCVEEGQARVIYTALTAEECETPQKVTKKKKWWKKPFWIAVIVVAALIGGYGLYRLLKKEPKKKQSQTGVPNRPPDL